MKLRSKRSALAGVVLLGVALALVLPACTEQPRVHTAGLATAPFDRYETFSFGPAGDAPEGTYMTPGAVEARRVARGIIATALVAKGYVVADGKGDFVVTYGMGRTDSTSMRRHDHTNFQGEDEDEDFTTGALVIDIFDGRTDGQVWHGASRVEIHPPRVDPDLLKHAVRDVLASFPDAKRTRTKLSSQSGDLTPTFENRGSHE